MLKLPTPGVLVFGRSIACSTTGGERKKKAHPYGVRMGMTPDYGRL